MNLSHEVLLTGFCDEISASKKVDEQFSVAAALGLRFVTLRFLDCGQGTKNVVALDEFERSIARQHLCDFGLQVSSLGSPLGKVKIVDQEDDTRNSFRPWKDYLNHEVAKAIELAQFFETKLIRGFSFYHPKGSDSREHLSLASQYLLEIVEQCAEAGLVFGLEVEANLIGHNALNLLELVERVDHPSLKLVFDGANLVTQGYLPTEVFSQWQQMKPFVGWLHIKDYRSEESGNQNWVDEERLSLFVPVGEGDSNYEQVFRDISESYGEMLGRMAAFNVPGLFLDLEPHLAGGGQFGGFSGPDGFGVALRSLCEMLDCTGLSYRLRGFDDLRKSQTN